MFLPEQEFTKSIYDLWIFRFKIVRLKQDRIAFLDLSVYLIQIAYHAQRFHALNMSPIDRVSYFQCLSKISLSYQRFYIIKPNLILIFVQRDPPCQNALKRVFLGLDIFD